MTDKRTCSLLNQSAGLLITVSHPQTVSGICVYLHDFPGKNAMIRVDNSRPIELPRGCVVGSSAARIVKAILAAKRVRTRWYAWPYDTAVDDDYEINSSLADALEIAGRAYKAP
jgi:hypothetical protein